jgi:hypothetical protein
VTAIRVARRDRYTAIDRRTINDETLSFRARGILIWLLDKPDDWRVDSEQIAAAAKEGRDAVRTALNELVTAGYIVRIKEQDDRGHWISSTWVHERPVSDDWKPDVGSSDVGEPGAIPKTETEDCDRREKTPSSPRERDRNPTFDALADACGYDYAEMTKRQARACAVAAAEIAKVGGTPQDVRDRVAVFRAKHPGVSCTPNAIANQWAALRGTPEQVRQTVNGHRPNANERILAMFNETQTGT